MTEFFLVLYIVSRAPAIGVIPDRYATWEDCRAAGKAWSERDWVCVPAPKRDCHTIHNGSVVSVPCQVPK